MKYAPKKAVFFASPSCCSGAHQQAYTKGGLTFKIQGLRFCNAGNWAGRGLD